MPDTKFQGLTLNQWRQFKSVDLEFSPSVTILTGRNGTGKTSILNILAQHSQYSSQFLGSPVQARDSLGRYTSGVWHADDPSQTQDIGSVSYDNGEQGTIRVSDRVDVGFNVDIVPQVPLAAIYIPSDRRMAGYRRVESIPTNPVSRSQALQSYQDEFWSAARGGVSRTPPLTKMKEAIVSMAVFGLGNDIVTASPETYAAFTDFEARLQRVIPKNIGFRRITVQVPDVVVETDSGRFLIDASSGGLMSLIDVTWQLTLFARDKDRFVVLIDEPENHLHPSMQREFLPSFVSAFPEAQFIVATHSPFIVSSVRQAKVYVFDLEHPDRPSSAVAEDLSTALNAVITKQVDLADRTSASEILRNVLGVPISIPIWAEETLDAIAGPYKSGLISPENLQDMHNKLRDEGLEEFLPEVVARAYNPQ